jgi:hypothetical protein
MKERFLFRSDKHGEKESAKKDPKGIQKKTLPSVQG